MVSRLSSRLGLFLGLTKTALARTAFFAVLGVGAAVHTSACSLNPQPLPPFSPNDASANLGTGASDTDNPKGADAGAGVTSVAGGEGGAPTRDSGAANGMSPGATADAGVDDGGTPTDQADAGVLDGGEGGLVDTDGGTTGWKDGGEAGASEDSSLGEEGHDEAGPADATFGGGP